MICAFGGPPRTAYTWSMAQSIDNAGTVLLTTRVPARLAAELHADARRRGSTVSEELRELVEQRVGATAQGKAA